MQLAYRQVQYASALRAHGTLYWLHAASYFLAVIIRSPTYIHGILIMPLKDGLTMYSPDLVTVGAMRSPRLDRRLFMDSICSDQSVSHKWARVHCLLLTAPTCPSPSATQLYINMLIRSYFAVFCTMLLMHQPTERIEQRSLFVKVHISVTMPRMCM